MNLRHHSLDDGAVVIRCDPFQKMAWGRDAFTQDRTRTRQMHPKTVGIKK